MDEASIATFIEYILKLNKKKSENIVYAKSKCMRPICIVVFSLDLFQIVKFQVRCTFTSTQISKPLSFPYPIFLFSYY